MHCMTGALTGALTCRLHRLRLKHAEVVVPLYALGAGLYLCTGGDVEMGRGHGWLVGMESAVLVYESLGSWLSITCGVWLF